MKTSFRIMLERCLKKHGYLTFSLFLLSIWYMLKNSDLPICRLPFGIERLFLKPAVINNTLISIATGYFSSYFLFILTTWIPQKLKEATANKQAYLELRALYLRMILFLSLIYKNVCSEEEWKEVLTSKTDIAALIDEQYYDRMQQFDISAKADSILLHKDTRKPLKWHERIEFEMSDFYQKLVSIHQKYLIYLPDELNAAICNLKTTNFVEMFTGNYTQLRITSTGHDGYKYFDEIPVYMYYSDESKRTAFFNNNNILSLREFIAKLDTFQRLLASIETVDHIDNRYALKQLTDKNAGHTNYAKLRE